MGVEQLIEPVAKESSAVDFRVLTIREQGNDRELAVRINSQRLLQVHTVLQRNQIQRLGQGRLALARVLQRCDPSRLEIKVRLLERLD